MGAVTLLSSAGWQQSRLRALSRGWGFGVVIRGLRIAIVGLIALAGGAQAADLPGTMATKAPPPAPSAYDWSGFYVGGHVGYALGGSNFSATQGAGLPNVSGSLDFSNAYNFSTGSGSYLLGLQAGYDSMTASRWLLGVAADISFPSFVGGNTTFSSGATGTVELSGSGRVLRRRARPRRLRAGQLAVLCHRRLCLELRSIHPHADWPACRRAAPRPGTIENLVSGAARSAARSAPASKSRWRRTGPRSSNICSPITPTAASPSRPARKASIPI